jgi:hypothetical protein
VESARATSDAAGTTESFALITAFDGLVTEKMVSLATWRHRYAADAPGGRARRLDVRGRVAARTISLGAVVPVLLDSGTGGGTMTVSGTVAEIGRAVDADARAFLVKITVPTSTGLRSGMFGRARFSARTRRALTVPADALVHRGQLTSVFVVENGIAHVRLVNVSGTEVLAGLSEGDVAIVAAPPTVTDGRGVTVGGR